MCKTAFLIQSTRIESDIKINAVFTPENAGDCKTAEMVERVISAFCMGTFIFGLKTGDENFIFMYP